MTYDLIENAVKARQREFVSIYNSWKGFRFVRDGRFVRKHVSDEISSGRTSDAGCTDDSSLWLFSRSDNNLF